MKKLIVLLVLLPLFGAAQVAVDASVRDSVVRVAVRIDRGWRLYAGSGDVTGAKIVCDGVVLRGSLRALTAPVVVRDEVFGGKQAVFRDSVVFEQGFSGNGVVGQIKIVFSGYAASDTSFLPVERAVVIGRATGNNSVRIASINIQRPLRGQGASSGTVVSRSAWSIFFLGLLGGLVALLTPCVFPMVPVTVSFFTNASKTRAQAVRNGVLYGVSIVVIYLLASLPFHLIGNLRPELLNNISTSVPLNLIFFAIFFVFALSFFGLFNVTLPHGMTNKVAAGGKLGSLLGIFFLALTLAIVSFSCTGPIMGSLLVGTANGGAWLLTAGCGGFGLALGLPFALFAIFPQWLKRLPKSGGWMETVKVSLAFVELALAFKFLSNADLVMHWGILKREVFIAIWILIGLGLVAYLVDLKWWVKYGRVGVARGRVVVALCVGLFVAYLVPGMWGARLSFLSGFPPPLSYAYNVSKVRVEADFVNDYEGALTAARASGKKILIDCTGWACVNCRKMEEQVWTDAAVAEYIRENFVLVSLYVDDKKRLPDSARVFGTDGHDLVTHGDKWAAFEIQNFGQSTQPLYAVVDTAQRLVSAPVGYTPNASKFLQWLQQ